MPYFDPFISINTALTAINTHRTRKLSEQQLAFARQQAVREVEQFQREQERQDMELRYRLDTDAQFREWYERDQQAKQERLALEAAQRAYQAQVDADAADYEKRERLNKVLLAIGILFIPYVVVLLPYTRRRLNMDWRYWVIVAWAVVVAFNIVKNWVTGP